MSKANPPATIEDRQRAQVETRLHALVKEITRAADARLRKKLTAAEFRAKLATAAVRTQAHLHDRAGIRLEAGDEVAAVIRGFIDALITHMNCHLRGFTGHRVHPADAVDVLAVIFTDRIIRLHREMMPLQPDLPDPNLH